MIKSDNNIKKIWENINYKSPRPSYIKSLSYSITATKHRHFTI